MKHYGHFYVENCSISGGTLRASHSIKLKTGFKGVPGIIPFKAEIAPVFTNCNSASSSRLANYDVDNPKTKEKILHHTNEQRVKFDLSINSGFIFPNPNNGQFYTSFDIDEGANIEIYNLMGKLVLSLGSIETVRLVDISDQPKGIYLVKIKIGNDVFNEKIVYQ